MITGRVNVYGEATIRLPVRGADRREHEIEAILDTGFTGSLTLPSTEIALFQLPWRTRGLVVLGNGAEDACDIYAATVIWDGAPRRILVEAAATTPLVGMALLNGYHLHLEVVAGGSVIIEKLS